MTTTTDITAAAATLGRKGGSAKTEAKTAAARSNGAKGGRPAAKTATAKQGAVCPGDRGIAVIAYVWPNRVKLVGYFGTNQGTGSNFLPDFFGWQIEAPSASAALAKMQGMIDHARKNDQEHRMEPYMGLARQAIRDAE